MISIDAKKLLTKFNIHLWKKKTSPESGHRGNIPQHNIGQIWQITVSIILSEKLERFSLGSGTRQGCLLLPLLCNMVFKVLATAVHQENNINWKEVKLSLFVDDLILYIESPKDATKKTTRSWWIWWSYRTQNIQKSVASLYTDNEVSDKSIYHCIKKNKIPRNNPKEVKDLYSEN